MEISPKKGMYGRTLVKYDIAHMTGTSPCTDGEDEDMGPTDDSTKMSQLSPPKSDRPRIAGTRFKLAFDQHIGFHTGFT